MSVAAPVETEAERVVREEQEAHEAKLKAEREGKLFEVPRLAVVIDESDPNVLKISFSGGVELDRGDKKDVEFYNALKAGTYRDLKVTVFVAGPANVHRRDGEGDVDAIVQTKSLKVTDVSLKLSPLKEPERKPETLDGVE